MTITCLESDGINITYKILSQSKYDSLTTLDIYHVVCIAEFIHIRIRQK